MVLCSSYRNNSTCIYPYLSCLPNSVGNYWKLPILKTYQQPVMLTRTGHARTRTKPTMTRTRTRT